MPRGGLRVCDAMGPESRADPPTLEPLGEGGSGAYTIRGEKTLLDDGELLRQLFPFILGGEKWEKTEMKE